MAVLFSAVTLSADNNQVEFLTAGIPRDADDLEGWAAFEDFMDELASEQEVGVHVEAYLYGEGETVKATPEEVAYFTMRADADEEFLHDHCDNIEDADFTIQWSPDELYGVELELCRKKRKTESRSGSRTLQTSSGISSSEPSWWRRRTNTTPISSASPVW